MKKKTAVLGASLNPERYSFRAVSKLQEAGHEVVALGLEAGRIGAVEITTKYPDKIPGLHTISLYLNPKRQKEYYQYILHLKPERIIFNPGTENDELLALAEENGIETVEACTLVMLRLGSY
jgi:predicted CoA-binding protein